MVKYCSKCGTSLVKKVFDGQERLVCSNECGFVHWNNPTPVVAGLVKVKDDFILARNAKWPTGFFSLISGFLEVGELPEPAIAREVYEELGLTTLKTTFMGHYPYAQMNQIIIAYMVEAEGVPAPNDEIAEIKILSSEGLEAFDFGPLKLGTAVVRDWIRFQKSMAA
jgi:NAD+ diphosphatase